MSSFRSSPVTAQATPEWHSKPPSKSRTVAQKRVYGKRKANPPRAVFDHRSPSKDLKIAKADVLEDVQARLADIRLQDGDVRDTSVPNDLDTLKPEKRYEENYVCPSSESIGKKTKGIYTKTVPNSEEHVTPLPMQSKRGKQSQRMVEVKITPKAASPRRERRNHGVNTTGSMKSTRIPAPRLSSGCINDQKVTAYVRPILNEALSSHAAQGIQKFSSWAARARNMFEVVKLAEGSYGEVYKLRLREEACTQMSKSKLACLREYGDGVFKIVPLRAQRGPGSRKFTTVDEIVSEAKMLKYLDPIPGFARFREVHVVQGRFPETFQAAWDHYQQTKDDCLNPNPSSKAAYPDTQLWAIVEMDDAGCELEKFSWSSIFQIYDIFWGVAMALARAEEYAMFEHRDLHLGNVCIRTSRPNGCLDPRCDLETSQSTSGFGLSTLEATLIDYSLSRAGMQLDSSGTLEIVSSDLDQKRIFDAIGQDEDEALLRNTYRHMRAEVYTGNPTITGKSPNIDGIWAEYAPRTNLIWLLFLLKNLLKNRKPHSTQRTPLTARSANQTVPNKRGRPKKGTGKPLPKQDHPTEAQSRVVQLKDTLEKRLTTVLDLLDLEHGHEDMCCAADLVAYAIDSRWLEEKDFF